MKDWKGTKQKVFALQYANIIMFQNEDYYDSDNIFDVEQVGEKTVKENKRLVIDAFDTIQKCGKLPSELLEERNELLGFAKIISASENTPITHRKLANELINKIQNG